MEYDKRLTEELRTNGVLLNVNGLEVEYHPVPDGDGRPMLDSRQLRMELAMREKMGSPKDTLPSLAEVRANMGGFNYNLNRKEIWTRYLEVPTTSGKVPVWGYYPRKMQGRRPALVYVHGGAFLGGTPFTTENPCRLIAERADCTVWNVDYSLAPEHPYPIPCTQVYEVVRYLHDHSEEFQMDADRISVAGDSAGGNMIAAAVQMDRDHGTNCIAGQIPIYAKLTFTNHDLPGYIRDENAFPIVEEQKYLLPGMIRIGSDPSNQGDEEVYVQGRYDVRTPYISPAFGSAQGLPRTLFILAEYDGLRLEGEFYARKLLAAGVPVKVIRYGGVCHGFFDALGILPQSEATVNEIAQFLNEA